MPATKPLRGTPLDPSSPSAAGLAAYWTFTECAGVTLGDLCPTPHNGTIANGSWAGPAVVFNGSNTAIPLAGPSTPGEMTVRARLTFAAVGSNQAIIWDDFSVTNGQYAFRVNASNTIDWFHGGGSASFTGTVAAGTPYDITMVRAGAAGSWSIHCYVNGVEDPSSPQAMTANPAGSLTALEIGFLASVGFPLNATVEFLEIYDRALSGGEVRAAANRPYAAQLVRPAERFFAPAGGGSITGTGSGTLGSITASGSGGVKDSGTGSPSLSHITASGSGTVGDTGTGATTLGHVTSSGSGAVKDSGTGAATLGRITAVGVGGGIDSGSGSPSLGHISASGSGGVGDSGSGSPTLGHLAASGSGPVGDSGSGAATLAGVTASGSGTVSGGTVTGTGAATLGSITASGTGFDPLPAGPSLSPIYRMMLRRTVLPIPAGPSLSPIYQMMMRRRTALPPASTPPDLIAAVVARLRAQGVGTALGETLSPGGYKIWKGEAMGSPALPWIRIEKPIGHRQVTSAGGNFIERGQLQLSLFAASSTSGQALCDLIASGDQSGALDSPPLVWKNARLMRFLLRTPMMPDSPFTPSVGSPTSYPFVFLFDYWYSGASS